MPDPYSFPVALPDVSHIGEEETFAIPHLSPRETQVAGWLAIAATNERIAEELELRLSWVKEIVSEVLRKTKCPSREHFVYWFWRLRFAALEQAQIQRKPTKYR